MAKRIPLPKNRIRELRQQRGWSLAELGARCMPAMNASQIKKREDGVTAVTIEDMHVIADALEVHPADLLPLPPYNQQEKALLGTLRGLAEPDRDVVFRVADAFRSAEGQQGQEMDEPSPLPMPLKRGRR